MLDFPATGEALWALFDAGGPRPEYVLPVLWSESGFDASRPNSAGYSYYGVGQTSGQALSDAGVDPQEFLTWPASQQIEKFVAPMLRAIARQYGRLASGARVYQANFLPATLATSHGLDSVISRFGDRYYGPNHGLDWTNKGTITVRDLAHFIERAAADPHVQAAVGHTYDLRPGDRPHEPVLGEDFGSSSNLGMFAAAASFAVLLYALVKS
jgi:hypothetical protein